MEPTYEVWHFDGKRPELLSGGHPDKGVCRRVWRNSQHAVIARDGLVLEPKPSCDSRKARALASAIAEAHRASTGSAPTPAFVGAPGGDGKRLIESSSPALRALDVRRPAVEPMPAKPAPPAEEVIPAVEPTPIPAAFDEAPAPVVVVTRKPVPTPVETPTEEAPVSKSTRCPCGEPSAPTAADRVGGRPSIAEFIDLCASHRSRASARKTKGATAAEARAGVLATITGEPAASKPTSKAASKLRPSKPSPAARTPKATTADAPVSDLLAVVRRQRSTIDAFGGIDQAELVAATCARVGGAAALVALVDELARAVA